MRSLRITTMSVCVLTITAACNDLTQTLPAGVQDPNGWKTPEGASALYRGALHTSVQGFLWYAGASGMFTDELTDYMQFNLQNEGETLLDRRTLDPDKVPSGVIEAYKGLQRIRNHSRMAIEALSAYGGDSTTTIQAELYALQGLAIVMLAEGFCSGIPLSTVDFDEDYTYSPGVSTDNVLSHALALFDTAIALGKDSTRVVYLARIGKARASLFLNHLDDAQALVAEIPNTYRYELPIPERTPDAFIRGFPNTYGIIPDREGTNGLPYRSSKDPRSSSYSIGKSTLSTDSLYVPTRYRTGPLSFPIASFIEARLIEAEYDLRTTASEWLGMLNALRTNGTFTLVPNGDHVDTVWNAGTGQVTGLAPLSDPADTILDQGRAEEARISLLFTERAYWLFFSGHRQGDLRRLIRPPFRRDAGTLYPMGFYGPYGVLMGYEYGTSTTFPIPESERKLNPLYTGCISYEA